MKLLGQVVVVAKVPWEEAARVAGVAALAKGPTALSGDGAALGGLIAAGQATAVAKATAVPAGVVAGVAAMPEGPAPLVGEGAAVEESMAACQAAVMAAACSTWMELHLAGLHQAAAAVHRTRLLLAADGAFESSHGHHLRPQRPSMVEAAASFK